jgi:membrane protein DedA with SNARE-associated domain
MAKTNSLSPILSALVSLGGLLLLGVILLSIPNDSTGITHAIGWFLIVIPIFALIIWLIKEFTKKR